MLFLLYSNELMADYRSIQPINHIFFVIGPEAMTLKNDCFDPRKRNIDDTALVVQFARQILK